MEIKHLAPYLPYKVKAKFRSDNNIKKFRYVNGTVAQVDDSGHITCYDTVNAYPDEFKLLLRPLSELTDEVLSKYSPYEQMPMKDLRDNYRAVDSLPYGVVQILLERHFDIFDLIDQGLAEKI